MDDPPQTPRQRLAEIAEDILDAAHVGVPEDVYLTDRRSTISQLLELIDGRHWRSFPAEHTEAFLDELYLQAVRDWSPPISDDEAEHPPVFLSESGTSTAASEDESMD
eukprot:GHVU01135621.1.p1 GENE.GHVU01135621.1~~GHVU01135621.1.p1  ORF type:complete len:108 (+),score=15.67 GHVU01135621.1:485-808(+)